MVMEFFVRGSLIGSMVLKGFIPDHALELVLCRFEVVPGPVERLYALIISQVDIYKELLEIRMLKAILYGVALLRVEHKHLLEQAVSIGIRFGENLFHSLLVAFGELADVAACEVVTDEGHVIRSWCAENGDCSLDLI